MQIDSLKGERGKQLFTPEGGIPVKTKVILLTVDRKLSDLSFHFSNHLSLKIGKNELMYLFIKYELSRIVTLSDDFLFLL